MGKKGCSVNAEHLHGFSEEPVEAHEEAADLAIWFETNHHSSIIIST